MSRKLQIREVKTVKDLKTFIYLPEKIHKNHANWLHPLYIDEVKFFDATKNPAFKHSITVLFLAYENGKVCGRIMGIIPKEFNQLNRVKTARFCYFETYEDKEVFDFLIEKVEEWAKRHGSTTLIGPMGFSDKEPQGFLTKGFSKRTMMVTNCSFEYMKHFVEANAFKPFVDLCQYEVSLSHEMVSRYEVISDRVLQNSQVTLHEFTRTKDVKPFVRGVFDLINTTYTDIYGFTTVTIEEADEFAERFLPLLNPRLIKLITNEEQKVVAFVVAMPDLSQAIRKAKGRLFPLGWYHILRATRTSKRLVLLLGGVQNEMQNKGLDAALGVRLMGSALRLGFTTMDSHLIMRDNLKMRREIERLGNFDLYKEYTIYKKEIG